MQFYVLPPAAVICEDDASSAIYNTEDSSHGHIVITAQ